MKTIRALVLAALALFAICAAADASVPFSSMAYPLPATDNSDHSRVDAIAAADLNGDNRPDVVVYRPNNTAGGKVLVLLTMAMARSRPRSPTTAAAPPAAGRCSRANSTRILALMSCSPAMRRPASIDCSGTAMGR